MDQNGDHQIEEQAGCLYCGEPIERAATGRPRKFCRGRSCSQKYARRQKDPLVGKRREPPLWRQLLNESLEGRPRIWGRKVDGDATTFMAWNVAVAALRAAETGESFIYLPEHDAPAWTKVYAMAGVPSFDSLRKGERPFLTRPVNLDAEGEEEVGEIDELRVRVSRLEQMLWLQADETKRKLDAPVGDPVRWIESADGRLGYDAENQLVAKKPKKTQPQQTPPQTAPPTRRIVVRAAPKP